MEKIHRGLKDVASAVHCDSGHERDGINYSIEQVDEAVELAQIANGEKVECTRERWMASFKPKKKGEKEDEF
jgi:hypothetical protein